MNNRIRFAIIGTSKRSDYLYGPLLTTLKDDIELVGIWGRSEEKARALGEKYHVSWFTDLERMQAKVRPDAAVV
jgi:predicted dehydrogenase